MIPAVTPQLTQLAIVYALLAFLLLCLCLATRWHWAVFDEPSPARGHTGAIYIWVNPMKDNQPLDMPRVHKLPYEKDLHRILGDGIKKARDGNSQMGTIEPVRGAGGFAWLRPAGNDKLQLKLSDVPRAQLPEK